LPLTDEKFEALLRWLNSNRELAGKEYEAIRNKLVGMFTAEGFSDAAALADETIDRVADRLAEIEAEYEGQPVRYFRGVARNIIFEERRRKEIPTDKLPERPTRNVDVTEEYTCLLRCLKFLKPKDRDFILDYHVYDGADKITNHLTMAEELGVSVIYLRVKAHRARISLEKCVLDCVERLKRNEKTVTNIM
jgi:hypothetical protein